MKYNFPKIQTIEDILPHVHNRDEFIVAEREFGTVINYVVSMKETFDMSGPDDLSGAIRRECRGIIFDKAGNLVSRPFHKFFNINEREETQGRDIDMSRPHTIMEKMDGSMIRPLMLNGVTRLATKMGVTEVAVQAEEYMRTRPNYQLELLWLENCIKIGVTPLFEFVAPNNQIVIGYESADLVLLAIRHNLSGNYLGVQNSTPSSFTQVSTYGSVDGSLDDYVAEHRNDQGREGFIISFDGEMYKGKNDWYVKIHKCLERIRFDRNIVALILAENLDDAVGLLPVVEANRVRVFELKFAERLHYLIDNYNQYWNTVIASGLDRKSYAQEWMPAIKNNDPFAAAYVFGRFNGKDGREMVLQHIEKHLSTNVKWDTCAIWMGM